MTAERFQHVVVGGGPMGAATARYLADAGRRVMLLAPRDPAVSDAETAMPSSHADHSRVTRRLDTDLTWARLASSSIDRYRELERRTGVPFFHESGCLTVIEGSGERAATRLAGFHAVADALSIGHERVGGEDIRDRFPALCVAPRSTVLAEHSGAGWLDPRAYVRAQIAAGRASGLVVTEEPMTDAAEHADGVDVTTSSGRDLHADHATFAMGPYSAFDLPVAAHPTLVVYARTVVHMQLNEAQRDALGALPSLIVRGLTDDDNCYILPPAKYPDGNWYIKIGGGRRAQQLHSRDELSDWLSSAGDSSLGAALQARIEHLLPATEGSPASTQACAITVAESGLPMITRLSARTALVTGGNGHAAKSGDEVGRLAADMLLGRESWAAGYEPARF